MTNIQVTLDHDGLVRTIQKLALPRAAAAAKAVDSLLLENKKIPSEA